MMVARGKGRGASLAGAGSSARMWGGQSSAGTRVERVKKKLSFLIFKNGI